MIILNKKTDTIPSHAIYIGRGSGLGNPYPIGENGDRVAVINQYRVYLEKEINQRNPLILYDMLKLQEDSALSCYCKPSPCHGDIIESIWRERVSSLENQISMSYAGIGARATPERILKLMQKVSNRLGELGFILRSGGADGADTAFSLGSGRSEIYLPWPNFNGINSEYQNPSLEALRLAEKVHPNGKNLKMSVKNLMARNCHQILGASLREAADFVVCWTEDAVETTKMRTQKTGGTGQAIELADTFRIPVFNLARPDALERLGERVKLILSLRIDAGLTDVVAMSQ